MAKKVDELVGQTIRAHREEAGFTIAQVSRMLGITAEALESIECGEKQASPQALEALAAAFDVPISAFMEKVLTTPAANTAQLSIPRAADKKRN